MVQVNRVCLKILFINRPQFLVDSNEAIREIRIKTEWLGPRSRNCYCTTAFYLTRMKKNGKMPFIQWGKRTMLCDNKKFTTFVG